jgi:predicted nucleotidyltransferase
LYDIAVVGTLWGGCAMKVEAPRRAVTLDEVRAHRDEIRELGARFGIRNIRVFGSVARGDATAASDLDLLVDVDRGHGYLDMAGFALGVEEELGVFTQVATPGGLKRRLRDRVLRKAVSL